MPSTTTTTAAKKKAYEGELDCLPFAKVMCAFLAVAFWVAPHVLLHQNDTWMDKLPLACAVSLGALSVALQVRMSMFRTEMNYLASEKIITKTDRFTRWTVTQLNHTEYAPNFIAGLLFREYMRASLDKPLSTVGWMACALSIAGNYGFVVSAPLLYTGERFVQESSLEALLRQLGFTKLFRFIFVSVRYVALALLWVDFRS